MKVTKRVIGMAVQFAQSINCFGSQYETLVEEMEASGETDHIQIHGLRAYKKVQSILCGLAGGEWQTHANLMVYIVERNGEEFLLEELTKLLTSFDCLVVCS